jgi:hypothetical protein
MNEEVLSYRHLGRKIYTKKLREDMVERLRNYEAEVINRTFRNKMRKEVSLKLHNVTSKFSLRLEVKLRFLEQTKQKHNVLYSFVICFILTLRDRRQIGQIKNILEVRNIAEAKDYKRTWKHLNRINKGKIPTIIYMSIFYLYSCRSHLEHRASVKRRFTSVS